MRQPCKPDEISFVLTQIGRLCEAIKAEFDLIGVRMTWLVTSESFMFAAFATCIANLTTTKGLILATALRYLAVALPVFGAIVAILVWIGIRAAHSVVIRIKKEREELMNTLPEHLRIELVHSRDSEHKDGNLPAAWIPWLIVVLWAGALLSLPMPPW